MKAPGLIFLLILSLPHAIAAAPFAVTSTADSGTGSLRQALLDANAAAGDDTISFNIPAGTDAGCDSGSGVCTISPASPLPVITGAVTIDGYTQPGAAQNTSATGALNAVVKIVLNGANAGANVDGLVIMAGSSTVRGLVINRFSGNGIRLATNGGNLVTGNFIGTGVDGVADLGNGLDGIRIADSANNAIGGTAAGERNVISGNGGRGVEITGVTATGNRILGNVIVSNDAAGIDLGGDGQNSNDNDDVDAGPNNLLNFPAITGTSGNVVNYVYNGLPNAAFRIEFFINDAADPSGFGEGQSLVGSANITTGANGDASSLSFESPVSLSGKIVSATATRLVSGTAVETSEFSNAMQAPLACTEVTSLADNGDDANPTPGSLRAAIKCSNTSAGIQTITFAPGLTGTITLKHLQLTITESAEIIGPGSDTLAVSGGLLTEPAGPPNTFIVKRVFEVAAGKTVTVSGLTIKEGVKLSVSGTPRPGAGILNFGTLTLNDCVVRDHLAQGETVTSGSGDGVEAVGGAIANAGMLTLNRCWITNNVAEGGTAGPAGGTNGAGRGGAIANISAASVLVINDSTVSSNTADDGRRNNNGVGTGGGIFNAASASLTISNSTFSGNKTSGWIGAGGGGLFIGANGQVAIRNSTFAENTGTSGGGLRIVAGASVTLSSTIVARNSAPGGTVPDVAGALNSSSAFNLIGNGTGMSGISHGANNNIVGSAAAPINPLLGPLQNNEGPTPTRSLQTGSPALDKGTSNGLTTDQRGSGFPRTSDNPDIANPSDGTDIGAYEQNQVIGACSSVVTNANDSGDGSLREAIHCSNGTIGRQTISFNIPGGGPHTITLSSKLPALADEVTIDGYTQPGSSVNTLAVGTNAVLKIVVSNANVPGENPVPAMFDVQSGGATGSSGTILRGLVIQPALAGGLRGTAGVYLRGAGGHTVEGCFIGTNASGTAAGLAGGAFGIAVLGADNNKIGGSTPASRNLIGNNATGVSVLAAESTILEGNLIGTDAGGATAIPNSIGVSLRATVGTRIVGNTISGNSGGSDAAGVTLINNNDFQTDTELRGNFIGTSASGNSALPNAVGVLLTGNGGANSDCRIGIPGENGGNVISGNTSHAFNSPSALQLRRCASEITASAPMRLGQPRSRTVVTALTPLSSSAPFRLAEWGQAKAI